MHTTSHPNGWSNAKFITRTLTEKSHAHHYHREVSNNQVQVAATMDEKVRMWGRGVPVAMPGGVARGPWRAPCVCVWACAPTDIVVMSHCVHG